MRSLLAGIVVFAMTASVFAYEPDEVLDDPELESRARVLSTELRCLVCQNQSIDDSDAPLAKDLRVLLRERLKAGDSDAEAKQYLVDRYGEFVLLKPAFAAHTLLLWFLPFVLLLGGVALVIVYRRRTAQPEQADALSPDEQEKLQELLK